MVDLPVSWLLVGVLGAAVGSFLNVVILRTKHQRSFVRGRSQCPHCGTALSWWELLPVASFVIQVGRCRHCHKRLSAQYLIVELLAAGMFLVVWYSFSDLASVLAGWLTVSAMILVGVFDARWSLIPDAFTLVLGLAGLTMALVGPLPAVDSLLGAAAGAAFFGLQYILSKQRWVGSGDIFLGAALGLLLGWRMLGLGLMLAYFLGSLVAIWLLATKRREQQSAIAFGPYLVLGAFIAWIWGEQIVDLYFQYAIFR